MKYRELVEFEPIETVIQLQEAESPEKARQLVQTFVISDGMAEQLANLVFPNLQFLKPSDNKGILVVGNYGTGKSHLLSLISGIAEQPDLVKIVKNKAVADGSKSIAGKFKVIRLEIPSTKKSLRPPDLWDSVVEPSSGFGLRRRASRQVAGWCQDR